MQPSMTRKIHPLVHRRSYPASQTSTSSREIVWERSVPTHIAFDGWTIFQADVGPCSYQHRGENPLSSRSPTSTPCRHFSKPDVFSPVGPTFGDQMLPSRRRRLARWVSPFASRWSAACDSIEQCHAAIVYSELTKFVSKYNGPWIVLGLCLINN